MRVYADGSCKDNPGLMGIGVSIQNGDGKELEAISLEVGQGTNNQAEFLAAIEGTMLAYTLDPTSLELILDSELVVKALNGEYKLKNEELRELCDELEVILGKFRSISVTHVRRSQNRRAGALAKAALTREAATV